VERRPLASLAFDFSEVDQKTMSYVVFWPRSAESPYQLGSSGVREGVGQVF